MLNVQKFFSWFLAQEDIPAAHNQNDRLYMKTDYGFWDSPLKAENIAGGVLRFGDVVSFQEDVYWSESRPLEKGRMSIMHWQEAKGAVEILPAPYAARSKVHEYGGGALCACEIGVAFVNESDQDIYLIKDDGDIIRLTNTPNWRYADLVYDELRKRFIAIGEYDNKSNHHPLNKIISIHVNETKPETAPDIVVEGHDFFACLALSPCYEKLAFISWNLPDMPWDGAQLYLKTLNQSTTPLQLTSKSERGLTPHWLNEHTLAMVIEDEEKGAHICAYNCEENQRKILNFGTDSLPDIFLPLWQFGMRSVCYQNGNIYALTGFENGKPILRLRAETSSESQNSSVIFDVELEGVLDRITVMGKHVGGILASASSPPAIQRIRVNHEGKSQLQTLSAVTSALLSEETISKAEIIHFKAGDQTGYALYYPPTHAGEEVNIDQPAPLIVSAHGGPTGFAGRGFDAKIQYFTSRGFGYLDVDYRGSAGYGRAYREALDKQWGIADVEDIISATASLIAEGKADSKAIFISGSSAGGYSVLSALTQSDQFAGGVSRYGICDMGKLAQSTHKFEAGYLDRLFGIGAKAQPHQRESVLKSRSPLYKADQISAPVLFLQGSEDKVVPPDQAEMMAKALKEKGIKTAIRIFEGEGHGFRNPENIIEALELELGFYQSRLKEIYGLKDINLIRDIEWL